MVIKCNRTDWNLLCFTHVFLMKINFSSEADINLEWNWHLKTCSLHAHFNIHLKFQQNSSIRHGWYYQMDFTSKCWNIHGLLSPIPDATVFTIDSFQPLQGKKSMIRPFQFHVLVPLTSTICSSNPRIWAKQSSKYCKERLFPPTRWESRTKAGNEFHGMPFSFL